MNPEKKRNATMSVGVAVGECDFSLERPFPTIADIRSSGWPSVPNSPPNRDSPQLE